MFPITRVFAVLLLGLPFSLQAQSEKPAVELAVIETIKSVELEETRYLNVYLPPSYHPDSAKTFPVIYLLDGSAHEDLLHIVGLVQFMNMYQLLPESIVVGIANVDRYRDFTYPSSDKRDLKDLPSSGGSQAFMDFLEKEAQPFIEANYPVSKGERTIIGQSMGGLLATEVLLKRPYLFDTYLIVSPSLWWDNLKMIKKADHYIRETGGAHKRVFISLGTEHPTMHKVADMLAEALQKHPAFFTVFYEPLPEEDHATILHRAVYRGFELLYPKEKE